MFFVVVVILRCSVVFFLRCSIFYFFNKWYSVHFFYRYFSLTLFVFFDRNQTPLQLAVENGHERARLQLINWRPPLFWQQTRHPSKVEFI